MKDFLSNFDDESQSPEALVQTSEVCVESDTPHEAKEDPTNMNVDHITEKDATYSSRKKKKIVILSVTVTALIIGALTFFFMGNRVSMPDFTGKDITEVSAWAQNNKIKLNPSYEYTDGKLENTVISQDNKPTTKVKKGSVINMLLSKGPDPDAIIPLPDFATLDSDAAQKWIEEHQATNLKIVKEFSDDAAEKAFLRLEIKDKALTQSTYQRKSAALIYYSKGKEVFEKTITVPNFKNKSKTEVEEWAKTNSISMSYETDVSDTVAVDQIISQTVSPDEKIAKKDSMSVTVSLGKSITVPNFANMRSDEASSFTDLAVHITRRYSLDVPFGNLISQSISPGTTLIGDDDKKIELVYSEGKPYLKDYRGQTEGDLERLFYEDYESKGANVTYTIHYVDHHTVQGNVVSQSDYNVAIPMDYHVGIYISKGNLPEQTQP